jgi:hypothetical protein
MNIESRSKHIHASPSVCPSILARDTYVKYVAFMYCKLSSDKIVFILTYDFSSGSQTAPDSTVHASGTVSAWELTHRRRGTCW